MLSGTFTPERYGIVELYDQIRDGVGDPVVIVKMAMDRETAETIFNAANSDCPDAHQRVLGIVRDLALGVLQLHMTAEIDKLVGGV